MDKEAKKFLRKTHIPKWENELIVNFGKESGIEIYNAVCLKYNELLKKRKPELNKALESHLVRGILPTLAVYKVFISRGLKQKEALANIDSLYRTSTHMNVHLYSALGHFPFFFPILRKAIVYVMKNYYPNEGWETTWIENSKDLISFDIRRCFYFDIFELHGCKELTQCCCNIDDYLYQNMSKSVAWERTMTLGRGDNKCSFRFRKR